MFAQKGLMRRALEVRNLIQAPIGLLELAKRKRMAKVIVSDNGIFKIKENANYVVEDQDPVLKSLVDAVIG